MVTRSYLEALSPGMRAKLDPLSRITGERGAARWPAVVRSEPDSAPLRHNLGPIERYKRRLESRPKVSGF
jgi:hypothetical protein